MQMDAYDSALRILRYRFNSEAELRRKLRAKRFEPADIDAALARLHAEKWLDDERFAGAFTRARTNKRVGAMRIRRELQAAGVSEDAAERAIAENVEREREMQNLAAICAKRIRELTRKYGGDYVKSSEGRARLVSYLIAQGYDSALVWQFVKDAE